MALAIFDLDNTLIAGDSDHAWGEFLVERELVDGEAFARANDQFYEDYKRGQLDIHAYLAFALEPLTRFSPTELLSLHADFMASKIAPLMLPKAQQLLQQHREDGDFLLIITATNRFVTGPIGAALQVDDLLASEPEVVDGRYTGRACGVPCFQTGKVTRLHAWLEQTGHTLEGSYFYSDSHNDIPLLQEVTYPIAVDPDDALRQHAAAQQWPIISLRD